MMLSDDVKHERIDAAVKKCEEQPTEIDMADLAKQTGCDNSDIQAFNMGLAIVAIGKVLGEQKKEEQQESL